MALIIVVAELPINISVRKGSAVFPTEALAEGDLSGSHTKSCQTAKCGSPKALAISGCMICPCGKSGCS